MPLSKLGDNELSSDSTDFEYEEEDSDNCDFELEDEDSEDITSNGEEQLSNRNDETLGVSYTFPVSHTKMNTKTHRMIYKSVSLEDMEILLDKKVTALNSVLQLGNNTCLILLVKYKWNQDKLLEDYTNGNITNYGLVMELQKQEQRRSNIPLIKEVRDPKFTCHICFNNPSEGRPLTVFTLSSCDHPFCVDCYINYLKEANKDNKLLLRCPEPTCKQLITMSDLQKISNFEWDRKNQEKLREEQKCISAEQQSITEEEIKTRYQGDKLSSKLHDLNLDDISDSEDEDLIYPSHSEEETDKAKCDTDNHSDPDFDTAITNFQQQIMEKERTEREHERNKTIASKYKLNLTENYCSAHYKYFKNCPIPNCDSMVMQVGFDSDKVGTLSEFVERKLVPTVVCTHKHRFCFNCLQEDHSPCPCSLAKEWEKKCKDDTETCHWLAANTKDCPHCSTPIEKNGGCNHMVCFKCGFAFCWNCLQKWSLHYNDFNCTVYVGDADDAKKDQDKNKKLLRRYMFYFELFDNQKRSLDADKKLLRKFENNLRKIQERCGVSWIEALFYRESMDILFRARHELMWTYATMYYIGTKNSCELANAAQQLFSRNIEKLSRLFLDTKIEMIFKQRNKFLNYANLVEETRELLEETFLDYISKDQTKLI
ncbi:hypothetical protein HII12_000172 [Brettanomyces bruxellensis]|uniref:RBR-type E3 ubiquitin transferase n=1 Tax=Dekkera bruxellensis TaxID=5007 RepID=A0A8H6EZN6_DEKBR|nr:hypothetical protein HII12_000172 [Brettanomyces bruxellensis]